jgi:hypothetical protein
MLETKPPLDHAAAERAIDRIRRPDVVRERLGEALLYSQRVEAEVAQLPIDVALPHASDDYLGRFLEVWTPDETGHGQVQARLLGVLGLRPDDAVTDDWLASHLAGLLGRASNRLYEVVLMIYHTVGAMNEKLAMSAYQAMGRIAYELDEPELADALFNPMRRDESMHLGYYRPMPASSHANCVPGSGPRCAGWWCRPTLRSGPAGTSTRRRWAGPSWPSERTRRIRRSRRTRRR